MLFPRFRSSPLLACGSLFAVWVVTAGCNPDAGARGEGALAVPPSGSVRVVATKVEETGARSHWKWTVIGDRNWRQATAETQGRALDMTLIQTYPLNSVTERGGCNTWECDLLVTRGAKTADAAAYTMTVHGSNGFTVVAKGEAATDNSALPVQIAQSSDTVTHQPAVIALATVGKTNISLRFAP